MPRTLRQLGRDHDDREPALGQLLDQRVDFCLRADVHALGRLVEDQDARTDRQPPCQRDLLLIPAGERADRRSTPTAS